MRSCLANNYYDNSE